MQNPSCPGCDMFNTQDIYDQYGKAVLPEYYKSRVLYLFIFIVVVAALVALTRFKSLVSRNVEMNAIMVVNKVSSSVIKRNECEYEVIFIQSPVGKAAAKSSFLRFTDKREASQVTVLERKNSDQISKIESVFTSESPCVYSLSDSTVVQFQIAPR